MPRTRIRRLVYFGAFVLLGLGVIVGLAVWHDRPESMATPPFEQKPVEQASVPYPPEPTPHPAPPPLVPTPFNAPPLQAMPDFPWPPPKASAWAAIPNELVLAGAPAATFEEVERRIGRALDVAGYYQRSLFAAPHGFAVVTQLERIEGDGAPAGASRWLAAQASATFSLVDYLKRLLYAEAGRYRLVVLIVSDVPFSATGGYLTASDASELASRGVNALPQRLAEEPYSPRHLCTALIYEFRKVPNGEPEFVAPSPLLGRDHLVRSNIWAALTGAQKN